MREGIPDSVKEVLFDLYDLRGSFHLLPLTGDGSTRRYYRIRAEGRSSILLVYPREEDESRREADSFFLLGRHLLSRGIRVPRILHYQGEEGWFLLEDLGDELLQRAVQKASSPRERVSLYMPVIGLLLDLQINGREGFDPRWSYQGPRYDMDLMLDRESGYFLREFVQGMCGMEVKEDAVWREFHWFAERASHAPPEYFMHRDFQSRNIILKGGLPYTIDFQGGRLGPLQYDLASLLLDPYVGLEEDVRSSIMEHYLSRLRKRVNIDPSTFLNTYPFVALFRNMQMLGAFSFLSLKRGKAYFRRWIPRALTSLHGLLMEHPEWPCPVLRGMVSRIMEQGGLFHRIGGTRG